MDIKADFSNIDECLEQSIESIWYIHFKKGKEQYKMPNKDKLKDLKLKLKQVKWLFTLTFENILIKEDFIVHFDTLKCDYVSFIGCKFDKNVEKYILKILKSNQVDANSNSTALVTVDSLLSKSLLKILRKYYKNKGKSNPRGLFLTKLNYKEVKILFFGIYLFELHLENMNLNNTEIVKLLKNLRGTKALSRLIIESKEAKGMIHNFVQKKSKIETKDENKTILNFELYRKQPLGILLVPIPSGIKYLSLRSSFREKDFKYLCSKIYKLNCNPKNCFRKLKQSPLVQFIDKL